MSYHLAQLNIARFLLPQEHPNNADFVANIDRVNAVAETQPGFIWRLTGEGNDALDLHPFDDADIVVNMSVWSDLESLVAFVFRSDAHRTIMRRRREWFEKIGFYLVLWWVPEGHVPTIDEAKERLSMLEARGPSPEAFTFRHPFPKPDGAVPDTVEDVCG